MDSISIGKLFEGPVKHVTSYRTWLFSGGWPRVEDWPAKNVHTDMEFALQCGLPTRGASAAMLQAYISELMINIFGEDWLVNGSLDLKFIQLVKIDDQITTKASVVKINAEGLVELNVWCENQSDEKVCLGLGMGRVVKSALIQ